MIERLRTALGDRYEILREIGEGGMATVYLADDAKHGRKVAVKVLRPELAAVIGGERFIAEIMTTAALQHPHILPLFDSGEADSFLYYVMPFVEGESLRARLDREGQLEVDEAVRIAGAVASALQYAHERDVVHRDIKPENILLHAGEPVVADFGIAIALSAAGGGRMTETGLSLGTPHYMSPEQAAADRDLGPRSDVYSLACVLYEMLAGQPPHTGPNAQSVLVRILTEEPQPVSSLRATVPVHVGSAIEKAVEKLPADRFRSAGDFKAALEDPSFTYRRAGGKAAGDGEGVPATTRGAAAGTGPSSGAGGPWARRLHAALTLALAGGVGWLALADRDAGAGDPDGPVVSFVAADSADPLTQVEVASDGTIAFLRDQRIEVRPPGALDAVPVPGVDDVRDFALSPDGRWLVFTGVASAFEMKKVPATGGPVAGVWSGPEDQGIFMPHWGRDGWIYFASGPSLPTEIRRVRDVGGDAELLLAVEDGVVIDPRPLPGGPGLLFTRASESAGEGRVLLLDVATGDTTEIVSSGFDAQWSPTGDVVYGHPSGALWALPFDLDRLEPAGPPTPVLDGVATVASFAAYGLGSSGILAYVTGSSGASDFGTGWTFALRDTEGNREPIPLESSDHWDARVSPDGRSLAYTREDDIWILDLDRGTHVALTEGGTGQHNPIWSPDGTRIVYRSDGGDMRVRPVDRSAPPDTVPGTEQSDNPMEWLPDGTVVVFSEAGPQQGDLWAVDVAGGAPARPLLTADWLERHGAVSPDGSWIAYLSARDGTLRLYARTWPGLQNETRVSRPDEDLQGVALPQWSPDGGTLYYQVAERVMAARLATAEGLTVEAVDTLPFQVFGGIQDVHPDGRLLVAEAPSTSALGVAGAEPARLVVITNWFGELTGR